MTRIDHTGHNHPNTTAARTACRKALKTAPVKTPTFPIAIVGHSAVQHLGLMDDNGQLYAVACGAGMGRGVRRNSPLYFMNQHTVDHITCTKCLKKV